MLCVRNVPYSVRLHRMGISQSEICKWHIGIAPKVQLIESLHSIHVEIYTKCIGRTRFGMLPYHTSNIPNIFDLLSALTKQYIHRSKCKDVKPSVFGLERYIKNIIVVKYRLACKSNHLPVNFKRNWDKLFY